MKYISELIPFNALDGKELTLVHWSAEGVKAVKGPVLLVHGAGVRANLFNPPNDPNFVQFLLGEGYDVWCVNWRASIEVEFNEYDLDQAAVNDYPPAVKKIVELTGQDELKAVIHCQGSTSFMISAVLGLVPEVKAIVSSAVALHPVVPAWSRFKMTVLLPMFKPFVKYLDAQWGKEPKGFWAKLINAIAQLTHWENDTKVGKFSSFQFGSGFPAMWLLKNLSEKTKQWITNEFGKVPITFYAHIAKGIQAGHLVPFGRVKDMPASYADGYPKTDARFTFIGGRKNRTFLWQSQQQSFEYFEKIKPDFHSVHIFEEYSHLDVFLGKNASKDVFPVIVEELNKTKLNCETASQPSEVEVE